MAGPGRVYIYDDYPSRGGTTFRLWNFDNNESRLKIEHQTALAGIVMQAILSPGSSRFVHLFGLASQPGTHLVNLRLSELRIREVRRFLVAAGIPEFNFASIVSLPLGEGTNDPHVGLIADQDRAVEIVVLPSSGTPSMLGRRPPPREPRPPNPSSLYNLLVFYGGYNPGDQCGGPLTMYSGTHKRSAASALEAILRMGKFLHCARNPCKDNDTTNLAIQEGISFIHSHLRSYANLLVYGYSTGGFNALNLCRRLKEEPVPVQVKLLITVDACLKRDGRFEDPGAKPNNVQTHINFYQQEIGEEFRGSIIPGAVNTLMVARHEPICRATVPEVCGMVANALGG